MELETYIVGAFFLHHIFVFCSNYMLDISGGFHEMGGVRWQLTLCLLLCWVIVFFSLAKGITVSGKVMHWLKKMMISCQYYFIIFAYWSDDV